MTTLTPEQKEDMSHHLQDVWFIQSRLEMANQKATREEAYLSWAKHSDRHGSKWIDIKRNPEMVPAILQAHEKFKTPITSANTAARLKSAPALSHPDQNLERQSLQHSHSSAREMLSLGYSIPEGKITEHAERTMDHIIGRYKNIAYMAGEIDRLDGVSEHKQALYNTKGAQQFHHLRDTVSKHEPGIDQCYVALRRLQRNGEHDKLKAGVALLVMADQRIIGLTDALKGMGDDGILPDDTRDLGQKEPMLIRSKGIKPKEPLMLEHALGARKSGSER